MVAIRQNLMASSKYYLKCPSESSAATLNKIVVHNTANDASASNEISYMIGNSNADAFHYAVDDKEIVQGCPLDRGTFSTSNRAYDVSCIAIEICYSKSGGDRFIKAEENAAEFIASLLKARGWGIDRVVTHQMASGKYCPHRTLDMGWSRFVNKIQTYLKQEQEADMTEAEAKAIAMSAYNEVNPAFNTIAQLKNDPTAKGFAEYVEYLVQIGAVKGDGKTALGGIRLETLKALVINARKDDIENPLYENLSDVPAYWQEDVKALIEAGKIAGEKGKEINMKRDTLKAIIVANRN